AVLNRSKVPPIYTQQIAGLKCPPFQPDFSRGKCFVNICEVMASLIGPIAVTIINEIPVPVAKDDEFTRVVQHGNRCIAERLNELGSGLETRLPTQLSRSCFFVP